MRQHANCPNDGLSLHILTTLFLFSCLVARGIKPEQTGSYFYYNGELKAIDMNHNLLAFSG